MTVYTGRNHWLDYETNTCFHDPWDGFVREREGLKKGQIKTIVKRKAGGGVKRKLGGHNKF